MLRWLVSIGTFARESYLDTANKDDPMQTVFVLWSSVGRGGESCNTVTLGSRQCLHFVTQRKSAAD